MQAALHNPDRGEVTVDLGGRSWVLRPTFEAISEIEAVTGKSIIDLSRAVGAVRYSARDLAVMVTCGLKGAGEKSVQVPTVGQMIVQKGVANPDLVKSVADFLERALNGGATPGEAGAAGEK